LATREFLEQRVKSAEEHVEKAKKRIERLKVNYAKGDYHERLTGPEHWIGYHASVQKDYDREMQSRVRGVEKAYEKLDGYQKQLGEASAKYTLRNIPQITEFLNRWEARMVNYFEEEWVKYVQAEKEYKIISNRFYKLERECHDYKKQREIIAEHEGAHRKFKHSWGHVLQFERGYHSHDEWSKTMRKEMAAEKGRKYDFIISRTMELIGQITDASLLSIGQKGDLNGYIKGINGTAHVQTVGAGGWNIQCFHFRTLINKVK